MAVSVLHMLSDAEKKYLEIPSVIYHYTSPEGVISIIDKHELWFSRFDCLNDASEGAYINDVYARAIGKLQRSKEIEKDFLDKIKDVKPDYYRFFKLYGEDSILNSDGSEVTLGILRTTKPYLCCFSTDRDSLPMWNYYSKDGQYEGYNIGFVYDKTVKDKENINVVKVIYSQKDQDEIMTKTIKNMYENHTVYGYDIKRCRESMASILSSRSIQFKNKAFQHEKEVRLIYWEPEKTEGIEYKQEEKSYRQKKGIIIPFLKIKFEKDQINSLMIGPLIQADIAENTAKQMLAELGYTGIEIKNSKIPIRY